MQVIRSQVGNSTIGPKGDPTGSLRPNALPHVVEPVIGLRTGGDGHPLGRRRLLLHLGRIGQSEESVQVDHALAIMKDLYRPLFLNETPFVFTDLASSELSKYAANAFLATKISFVNELAILCDDVGGDVQGVARAMGLDRRIGSKFLHAGPGFGGSCFPKDTRAAAHFVRSIGRKFEIVEAAMEVNARQLLYAQEKIQDACGGKLAGKTVAMLGLSFKPETDDIREGSALGISRGLLKEGASIRAFDPQAMTAAADALPEITLCEDAYDAAKGADVLVIVTEWNEFRALAMDRLKKALKAPKLVDLRNIYDPETVRRNGLEYWGIGRR